MKYILIMLITLTGFAFAQESSNAAIPDTIIIKRLLELESQFNANTKQIEQLQLANKLISHTYLEFNALLKPEEDEPESEL